MEEIWMDIIGYEGLYKISNLGRIKSFHKTYHKILHNILGKNGYYYIDLSKIKDKRRFYIHRLLAQHFISNPNNYLCINHIDGNKLNNSLVNLEWCTYSYNNKEAYKLGLKTPKDVRLEKHPMYGKIGINNPNSKKVEQYNLDNCYIKTWDCIMDINRDFNYCTGHIIECCRNKRKTAYGYKWKYKEEYNNEKDGTKR